MFKGHIIEKQRVVVDASAGADIRSINHEIFSQKEELMVIIEELFDRYFPGDELVEIDKITLDLGQFLSHDFGDDFKGRFKVLLEGELAQLVKRSVYVPSFSKLVAPKLGKDKFNLLEDYLIQGYNATLQAHGTFNPDQLFHELLAADRNRMAIWLQRLWRRKEVRLRLLRQMSPATHLDIRRLLPLNSHYQDQFATNTLERIKQYFEHRASAPGSKKNYASDLENDIRYSLKYSPRDITAWILDHLGASRFRVRMAELLPVELMRTVFEVVERTTGSRLMKESIHEWSRFERIFVDNSSKSRPTYLRLLYLEYLAGYAQSPVKKARLLFKFVQAYTMSSLYTDWPRNEAVLKQLLESQNKSGSEWPKIASALQKHIEKQDQGEISQGSKDPMSELLYFLMKGLLRTSLKVDELLTRILASHTVLLQQVVMQKWQLFQVRYRLAYQFGEAFLPEVTEVLFGETAALEWLRNVLDVVEVERKKHGVKADVFKRHLYFAFFEVTARHSPGDLEWEDFLLLMAREVEALVPMSQTITAGGEKSPKEPLSWKQFIQDIFDHVRVAGADLQEIEEEDHWQALLAYGATSSLFSKTYSNPGRLEKLLKSKLNEGGVITLFSAETIHNTWWSEVLTRLSPAQAEEVLMLLLPFQKRAIEEFFSELRALEEERGKTKQAFYPLPVALYVILIRALTASTFMVDAKSLVYLMLKGIFLYGNDIRVTHYKDLTKLKPSEAKKIKHRDFLDQLMLTGDQGAKYPWVEAFYREISGTEKAIYPPDRVGEGVSEPFTALEVWRRSGIKKRDQNKYTTTDLLKYYFQTGLFPVWSKGNNEKEIRAIVEKGLNVAPGKIREVLFSLASKKPAISRWVTLLKKDTLHQSFVLLDEKKHKMLTVAIGDILRFSRMDDTPVSPEGFHKVLLAEGLIFFTDASRLHRSHEYMIIRLIDCASQEFSFSKSELLAVLRDHAGDLKSQALREAVSHRELATDNEEEQFQQQDPDSHSTKIDTLLYLMKYQQWPWWLQEKDATVKAVIDGLIHQLLPKEFESLMAAIEASGDEYFYISALFKHTSSKIFFNIINYKAAGFSGFITTWLLALEALITRQEGDRAIPEGVYLEVLGHISKRQSSFSAIHFIEYITPQVAKVTPYTVKSLLEDLIQISEERIQKGESRFVVLKSTLDQVKSSDRTADGSAAERVLSSDDLGKMIQGYFKTGLLKGYGKREAEDVVRKAVENIISHSPGVLIRSIKAVKADSNSLFHLVELLDDKRLADVGALLNKRAFSLLSPALRDLLLFSQRDMLPVSGDRGRQLLWQQALTILLDPSALASLSASEINTLLMKEIAARLDVSMPVLISVLAEYQAHLKSNALREMVATHQPLSGKTSEDEAASADFERILYHYLLYGSMPAGAQVLPKNYESLIRQLKDYTNTNRLALKALLMNAFSQTGVMDRVIRRERSAFVLAVVEAFLPGQEHQVKRWLAEVGSMMGVFNADHSKEYLSFLSQKVALKMVITQGSTRFRHDLYAEEFFRMLTLEGLENMLKGFPENISKYKVHTDYSPVLMRVFLTVAGKKEVIGKLAMDDSLLPLLGGLFQPAHRKVVKGWMQDIERFMRAYHPPMAEKQVRSLMRQVLLKQLTTMSGSFVYNECSEKLFSSFNPRDLEGIVKGLAAQKRDKKSADHPGQLIHAFLMVAGREDIIEKLAVDDKLLSLLVELFQPAHKKAVKGWIQDIERFMKAYHPRMAEKQVGSLMRQALLKQMATISGGFKYNEYAEKFFSALNVRDLEGTLKGLTLTKRADRKSAGYPEQLMRVFMNVAGEKRVIEKLTMDDKLLPLLVELFQPAHQKVIKVWMQDIGKFMKEYYSAVPQREISALIRQVLLKQMDALQSSGFEYEVQVRKFLTMLERVKPLKAGLPKKIEAYKKKGRPSVSFVKAVDIYLKAQKDISPEAEQKKAKEKEPLNIQEEKQAVIEGQLPVGNAGLVLLGPFLPRYFNMLGMVEKGKFKDEPSAARATHLLQYLVTGLTETPEHELVLNKVVCGLDLSYPLERSVVLEPHEVEVSEQLLNGVLQNWDKLKGSSVEALRESFLVRNGQLHEDHLGWHIHVEEKGIDALLDYLPWSFGLIKLSWMEKGLHVTWRK